MNLDHLRAAGFDAESRNHAEAVMTRDFPEPFAELCDALTDIAIFEFELIQGGGGESHPTQRLRQSLARLDWNKRKIVIRKTVDGAPRTATTHEIDHVRRTEIGNVALEIEWNNKDPFFDRDLENFQRLHLEGAISVGVIVTRGRSLQNDMRNIVLSFAHDHGVHGFDDLEAIGVSPPTRRQRRKVEQAAGDFASEWSKMFVADKFGTATTHWDKLQERVNRGVGNPCPLILVGIPSTSVHKWGGP